MERDLSGRPAAIPRWEHQAGCWRRLPRSPGGELARPSFLSRRSARLFFDLVARVPSKKLRKPYSASEPSVKETVVQVSCFKDSRYHPQQNSRAHGSSWAACARFLLL